MKARFRRLFTTGITLLLISMVFYQAAAQPLTPLPTPLNTQLPPPNQTMPPSPSTSATPIPEQNSSINKTLADGSVRFEYNAGQFDSRVRYLAQGSYYKLFLTDQTAVLAIGATPVVSEATQTITPVPTYTPSPTPTPFISTTPTPILTQQTRMNSAALATQSTMANSSERSAATATALISATVQITLTPSPTPSPEPTAVIYIGLRSTNPSPVITSELALVGKNNYFIGNDPTKWYTDVRSYASVIYQNVYDGIDQVWYGKSGSLEYDFVVAPGANPSTIRLSITGSLGLRIENEELVINTSVGERRWAAPYIYQVGAEGRYQVVGNYVLQANDEVGFNVPSYDPSQTLFIDPVVIEYSTYLGGSSNEWPHGIKAQTNLQNPIYNDVYVVGQTNSTDYPGLPQPTPSPQRFNVFVTKLLPWGTGYDYSTFIGGDSDDIGNAITVDNMGNAYITGQTEYHPDVPPQREYPAARAFQSHCNPYNNNCLNAFLTKLTVDGHIDYSTFLGSSSSSVGHGVAADNAGNAYVTGYTGGSDFPLSHQYHSCNSGGDAFVTKINTTLSGASSLIYSTCFAGPNISGWSSFASSIAIDGSGAAYITGLTSGTIPVTSPIPQPAYGGGSQDGFLAKLSYSGAGSVSLSYSTYLGGSNSDLGQGIALDSSGYAYIVGTTASTNFPSVNPLPQGTNLRGTQDAFITKVKVNPPSASWSFSTYLGGSCSDDPCINNSGVEEGLAVDVDNIGSIVAGGYTNSSNFPITAAVQRVRGSTQDGFVAKINPGSLSSGDGVNSASSLIYSTYYGGDGINGDIIYGVSLDYRGDAYIAGGGNSSDMIVSSNAYQPTIPNSSGVNVFVAKIANDDDGDGIPNWWESEGINGLNLPLLGASSQHKDVFIQIDYMEQPGDINANKPEPLNIGAVATAFAQAPLANPDGYNGINLHVDYGQWGTLSEQHPINYKDVLIGDDFKNLKKFSPQRVRVFHYVMYVDRLDCNSLGSGDSPYTSPEGAFIGSTLKVAIGYMRDPNTHGFPLSASWVESGALMHELGHNLGLLHGGDEDEDNGHGKRKPNYLSVMNNNFAYTGIQRNSRYGNFDYSHFGPSNLIQLNEISLNEAQGLGSNATNYGTLFYSFTTPYPVPTASCPNHTPVATAVRPPQNNAINAAGFVNWNNSVNLTPETSVSVDLNGDGVFTTMHSFNDWINLIYTGGSIGAHRSNQSVLTSANGSSGGDDDYIQPGPDGVGVEVRVNSSRVNHVVATPGPVTYSINVINTGRSAEDYIISVSSEHNWADTSQVPQNAVHILPQGSTTFNVTVNVPTGAQAATEDKLAITATGQRSDTRYTVRTIVSCSPNLSDVNSSTFLYDSIMFVACRDIMGGYTDTPLVHPCLDNSVGSPCFLPARSATRAEFAKVIYRAFGVPAYTPATQTFSDVPPSFFAYLYIESLNHANIMNGYTPAQCVGPGTPIPAQGCFKPNNLINRAEAAVTVKAAGSYITYLPPNPSFSDVPSSHFAYTAIETLRSKSIVSGNPNGCAPNTLCFFPNDPIRRDELSRIIRVSPK